MNGTWLMSQPTVWENLPYIPWQASETGAHREEVLPGYLVANFAWRSETEASKQIEKQPLEVATRLFMCTSGNMDTLQIWPAFKATGETVWPRSAVFRPSDFTPKQTPYCIPRHSCLFRGEGAWHQPPAVESRAWSSSLVMLPKDFQLASEFLGRLKTRHTWITADPPKIT